MFDKDDVLAAMQGRYADFYIQFTPLKPNGGELRGPCPLHGSGSGGANFAVNPETGLWNCFSGCQSGGDAFRFLEKLEGVPFPEALARVAAFAGVVEAPVGSQRQAARKVLPPPKLVTERYLDPAIAAELHRNLMNNDKFRNWLSDYRGLATETLERFQIGLLKDDRGHWRTTFPVYDRQGHLTNIRKHLFAYKRELTDDRRRELNKTLPWEKGLKSDLFPLSALQDTKEALLMEGEADALLANQLGFPAVSGTLGAGNWRPEWAEDLRGLKKVTVLYDEDEAGQKGARKAAASLALVVPDVRIARLPMKLVQGGKS